MVCLSVIGCGDWLSGRNKLLRTALSSKEARALITNLPTADSAIPLAHILDLSQTARNMRAVPEDCAQIKELYRAVVLLDSRVNEKGFRTAEAGQVVLFMLSKQLTIAQAKGTIQSCVTPGDIYVHFAVRLAPQSRSENAGGSHTNQPTSGLGCLPIYRIDQPSDGQHKILIGMRMANDGTVRFTLDGTSVDNGLDGIKGGLRVLRTRVPESVVVIDTSPDVTWGCLAKVMDVAVGVGLTKLRIQVTEHDGKKVFILGNTTWPIYY